MNPARMRERGLEFDEQLAGSLPNLRLAFNKRTHCGGGWAYANVVYAKNATVEGVLYRLSSPSLIELLDPFEGTPYRYSREIYPVQTVQGLIPAWVYIGNSAMLTEGMKPARWYLEHLLVGEPYLSASYFSDLANTSCLPELKS